MLSERSTLLLRLALLLVIGFLAVSLGAFQVSRNALRSSLVDEALPLTSDNIYSEVQKDILRPVFISSLMAGDTFLRDWVLDGERDISRISRYLAEIKTTYGTLSSFFVSANSSTYYTPAGVLKQVHPDEPRDVWFYRVRDMSAPYELNVDVDMANRDTRAIFINYRVTDYDGRFLGATGVGLTLALVAEQIQAYEQRFQRRIYFVDHSGRIVLGSRVHHREGVAIQSIPGLRDIASRILLRDETPVSLEYQHDGVHTLVNARHIPELDWHLLVEQSDQQAIGPVRQALAVNLGIAALVTLLVLGIVLIAVRRYQRRLDAAAASDPLTGALNRQAFDIVFELSLRETFRSQRTLALLLFDLDHFKQINDTYGHLAGDAVLRAVVGAVRSQLRDSDVLARWGGEEFIVLLKDCSREHALHVAEKLRQTVAAHDFRGVGPQHLTVSLGVSISRPDDVPTTLFSRADQALYQAKRQGRNRVEIDAT